MRVASGRHAAITPFLESPNDRRVFWLRTHTHTPRRGRRERDPREHSIQNRDAEAGERWSNNPRSLIAKAEPSVGQQSWPVSSYLLPLTKVFFPSSWERSSSRGGAFKANLKTQTGESAHNLFRPVAFSGKLAWMLVGVSTRKQ